MDTAPPPSRRHDLDNLRTFLTAFVTIHHTTIAYGGHGHWPFHSACFPPTQSPILLPFEAVAQSCGMGLFFWISGRMSSVSLSHSLPSTFVMRKVKRLGVPAVVFTLLVNPLAYGLAMLAGKADEGEAGGGDVSWRHLVRYWRHLRGVRGVVWYCAVLLTFDCVSASIASLSRSRRIELKDIVEGEERSRWEGVMYEGLRKWGWLVVAPISFFARIWLPVGAVLDPWCIQVAYLPQYVFAYAMGFMSIYRNEERFTGPFDPPSIATKPLSQIPDTETEANGQTTQTTKKETSRRLALPLRRALGVSFLTLPLCGIVPKLWALYSGHPFNPADDPTKGGWNASALTYAFWNEFSFVVLGPSVMFHFQRFHNTSARSWLWQPRYSYGAYLLHPLVSVGIEILVDSLLCRGNSWCRSDAVWWKVFVGPLAFTAVVGCVNASSSFLAARGFVGYIPGMKRIL